jgi:hypothetical protein
VSVAKNAPRIRNGEACATALRLDFAPSVTGDRSIQSGTCSMSRMNATSSGGASGTASRPFSPDRMQAIGRGSLDDAAAEG